MLDGDLIEIVVDRTRLEGSVNLLLRNANRALHEAKRRGKNQVWLYSGSEAVPADAPSPDRSAEAGT